MTSTNQTVLITAPGGNIGRSLVPALLNTKKAHLILPTSDASRLKSLLPVTATSSDVTVEQGNITNPAWIRTLLTNHAVCTVFLCLTGKDELITTLNFLDAMQRAGTVKHLLYISGGGDYYTSPEGIKFVFSQCCAEHVLVKSTIELKLMHGGFPWTTTTLGPMLFFDNDLRSQRSLIEEGIFPEPLGELGVSRVSLEDVAQVACALIFNPDHKYAGTRITIGSRKAYTGSEICALWSEALGKDVKMLKSDAVGFDEFEHRMAKMGVPADWSMDLRLMYETFGRVGFGLPNSDYEILKEILGRDSRDYGEWVAQTAKEWIS